MAVNFVYSRLASGFFTVLVILSILVTHLPTSNAKYSTLHKANNYIPTRESFSSHRSFVPSINSSNDVIPSQMLKFMLGYITAEHAQSSEPCVAAKLGIGIFSPPGSARAYRAVSTAMYNVWTRYDLYSKASPLVNVTGVPRVCCQGYSNRLMCIQEGDVAMIYAAYWTIQYLLPQRVVSDNLVQRILQQTGVDVSANLDSRPARYAKTLTDRWIEYLKTDKSNQAGCYADTSNFFPVNDPTVLDTLATVITARLTNRQRSGWSQEIRPTTGLAKARPFQMPHTGLMMPFAVGPNNILPDPYPGADVLHDEFMALIDIQTHLEDDDSMFKNTAEFWADGPKSTLPPGHWLEIALQIANYKQYNSDQTVRLLFMVSNSLYDASIGCWLTKRTYSSVRPSTYIPVLAFDNLTTIIPKQYRGPYCPLGDVEAWQWQPYQLKSFLTPPFPEYVSGHSTFSRAAAETIISFTGTDVFPDPQGYTTLFRRGSGLFEPYCSRNGTDLNGKACVFTTCEYDPQYNSENRFIPLQDRTLGPFYSLRAMAVSAGMSRRYGGIHIELSDLAGREMGAKVADVVVKKACSLMKRCTE